MKFKKTIRLLSFVILIAIASVFPVPMTFHSKDHLPKYLIEMVDKKEEDEDEETLSVN